MLRRWSLVVVPLALLAGCGGSDPLPPQVDEAAELKANAKALADFLITGQPSIPSFQPSGGMVAYLAQVANAESPVSHTQDCPGGGKTTVTGTVDRVMNQQERRTNVTWSVTGVHSGCVFTAEGRTITLQSGSITMTGTGVFGWPSSPGGEPMLQSLSIQRNGSLTFVRGQGESRTCQLALATTYNASTQQYSTTGTVCGEQVNHSGRPPGGMKG